VTEIALAFLDIPRRLLCVVRRWHQAWGLLQDSQRKWTSVDEAAAGALMAFDSGLEFLDYDLTDAEDESDFCDDAWGAAAFAKDVLRRCGVEPLARVGPTRGGSRYR